MADIGVTTIGANDRDIISAARGQRVGPVPVAEVGVTVTAYIRNAVGGTECQAAIIDTDGTTILAQSAVRTDVGSSLAWVTFSGGTFSTFDPSGLTFDLLVASESSDAWTRFDDGVSTGGRAGLITSLNPWVLNGAIGDNSTRSFSIYMTYTPDAGGGYSMTCDAGSYNLTGQDVALIAGTGEVMVCESGTYSLLGSDALIDLSMACASGSYALNGQDVGLLSGHRLVCENGGYVLLGQNVTLSYSGAPASTSGMGSSDIGGANISTLEISGSEISDTDLTLQ
jgi:hypothetical protein